MGSDLRFDPPQLPRLRTQEWVGPQMGPALWADSFALHSTSRTAPHRSVASSPAPPCTDVSSAES